MKATLGHIILAHQNFDRVKALAEYFSEHDSPVAIHVDKKANKQEFDELKAALISKPLIHFLPRTSSEWGRFSLVDVSLKASQLLLDTYPSLDHVMLNSGSCLPTRPILELKDFLAARKGSDFIESVSIENEQWVQDGLNKERFSLFFPFSWKTNRRLFDLSTKIQQFLGVNRKLPHNLTPCLGSQWWCLTRQTLSLILNDPRRKVFDRYFKSVWIPDESYFQTLAREHSERLESKSLTWVKFDNQGKPFLLYDDHQELLSQSGYFMARKIWSRADKLYEYFLSESKGAELQSKSNPRLINEYFEAANIRATHSKYNNINLGRFPISDNPNRAQTAREYTVIIGGRFLFPELQDWIKTNTDGISHGNIFNQKTVKFESDNKYLSGNISAARTIRNYDPASFLRNIIWNNKEKHQSIHFDLDDLQSARDLILKDPNARIIIIKKSWLLQFWQLRNSGQNIISHAKRLSAFEQLLMKRIQRPSTIAKIVEFEIQEIVDNPLLYLNSLINHSGTLKQSMLREAPKTIDLDGFNNNIRWLRNKGFPISIDPVLIPNAHTNLRKTFSKLKLIKE